MMRKLLIILSLTTVCSSLSIAGPFDMSSIPNVLDMIQNSKQDIGYVHPLQQKSGICDLKFPNQIKIKNSVQYTIYYDLHFTNQPPLKDWGIKPGQTWCHYNVSANIQFDTSFTRPDVQENSSESSKLEQGLHTYEFVEVGEGVVDLKMTP